MSFGLQLSNSADDIEPDFDMPAVVGRSPEAHQDFQRRDFFEKAVACTSCPFVLASFLILATAITSNTTSSVLTSDAFSIGKFNTKKTIDLPPVDITNKSGSLFTDTIPVIGDELPVQVSADFAIDLHVQSSIGAVVAGTIIPPKLKQAAFLAGMFPRVLL